jgi:hypothetical protein
MVIYIRVVDFEPVNNQLARNEGINCTMFTLYTKIFRLCIPRFLKRGICPKAFLLVQGKSINSQLVSRRPEHQVLIQICLIESVFPFSALSHPLRFNVSESFVSLRYPPPSADASLQRVLLYFIDVIMRRDHETWVRI